MEIAPTRTNHSVSRTNTTVYYQSTQGQPYQNTLWHLLVHVVNHGTQHRSEVAMVLTGLGYSPGDLNMLIYFRQSMQ